MTQIFEAKNVYAALDKACESLDLHAGQIEAQVKKTDDQVQLEVIKTFEEDQSSTLFAEDAELVKGCLQEFLEAVELQAKIDEELKSGKLFLNLDLEHAPKALTEQIGDLQFLLSRYYHGLKPLGYMEIECDINGSRRQKEGELQSMAQKAVDGLQPGESTFLPPLNSFERRIVHMTLKEIEGIETHSEGFGSRKKIKITRQIVDSSSEE